MLIVLEGLDGAGKTTQINLLQEYFEGEGVKTKYLHFPRYDSPVFGELIARFLRGDLGPVEQVHPLLVALLFAGDRREASEEIRAWLSKGYSVILDRYIYSNIAFQCAKCKDKESAEELRGWILNTELNVFKIPVPDLNIFLDVPLESIQERLNKSREGDERSYLNGKQDIHEACMEFQSKVREIYLEECNTGGALIRVDCSGSEGKMLTAVEVSEKIISYL